MSNPAINDLDAAPTWSLEKIIADLRQSREISHNIRHGGQIRRVPSIEELDKIVRLLSAALFPTHFGRPELATENTDYFVGGTLTEALSLLTRQVRYDLAFHGNGDIEQALIASRAAQIVRNFAGQLPDIRAWLVGDLRAAYRGDPAATNYPEILLGYPGMTAIIYYRLARALYLRGALLSARMIGHIAHSRTAIDIHPGAEIGRSFFIDHGTGVVIGETAVIGDRVRLYQAVTLGSKSFQADETGGLIKGVPRHPVIEDDVVIYAGATLLGRITIGQGAVIGGNVWLTQNVRPGSSITQADMHAGTIGG